jgi:AbiV family abortive infection protein
LRRIFRDACLLLERGRYPSAYGLAVLAYEELGKSYAIDWVCDAMSLNPDDRDRIYDGFLAPGLLHDHLFKQRRAHADTAMMEDPLRSWRARFVDSGGLEAEKQHAFYVELIGTSVKTPSRITRKKALAMLRDVLNAIEVSGDIGFNGFHCESTSQSQRLAAEALSQAHEAFAHSAAA